MLGFKAKCADFQLFKMFGGFRQQRAFRNNDASTVDFLACLCRIPSVGEEQRPARARNQCAV